MSDKKSTALSCLDLVKASNGLASCEFSSDELVKACLNQIELHDIHINAFTHINVKALAEAEKSDSRRISGTTLSKLDGIPIAVKDNIDVMGLPTTNGLNTKWCPEEDAEIIKNLKSKGIIILGKTNMHEAALGATTDNPHHGKTFNPKVKDGTPGGSSGGSGAAVGADFCIAALGTDTMGSVRVPAAYCGIVGFKPTTGFWSTGGVMPLSTTLDAIGPMTKTVEDAALLCEQQISPINLKSETLAVLSNFEDAASEQIIVNSFSKFKNVLRETDINFTQCNLEGYEPTPARRAGLIVCEVEAYALMEDILRSKPSAFSSDLRKLLEFGSKISGSKYFHTLQKIKSFKTQLLELFDEFRFVLSPTTPQTAFPFDQNVPVDQADFTALANFSGCPAISIPLSVPEHSPPVGLQIMAAPGKDAELLSVAASLQELIDENNSRKRCQLQN